MVKWLRFGSRLAIDTDNSALFREGVALPLGRRAVLLLLRLIAGRGEIVSKRALYEAAWPGQAVEESNLTVQIAILRRALENEEPSGRGWVETVPRRGYRFVGPMAAEAFAPPAPPRRPLVANVPIAVPLHFTGRETAMAAMAAALARRHAGPSIVALHGMPGLGKTVLAAAYAVHEARRYRATWWIRAEDPATARADLATLALRLGWVRADAPEAAGVDAAIDGLQREGDDLLLVYDNALDLAALRPFLPRSGAAHIVVTSNSAIWRAIADTVQPDLWSEDAGAAFLVARTGRVDEAAAAAALSRALGGLPLAHEQAAAFVESLDMPFDEYRRRLDAAPAKLLEDAAHAPADYHDGLTVARAMQLAIQQAAAQRPAAPVLLQHLALLAAEPVPLLLFRGGGGTAGPDAVLPRAIGGDQLDDAVAVLKRLSLLSREAARDDRDPAATIDSVRLHRLVRQVAAASLPPDQAPQVRASLTRAMVGIYPADVFGNKASWGLARRLDPIALPLVAPRTAIAPGAEADALELLVHLASYRHAALGAYEPARTLLLQALELTEAVHPPHHPMTATVLNNLALVLRDIGKLAQARPLHERALAIREAVLGADHPVVAVSLNNLANVLMEEGDTIRSVPLMRRALDIRLARFGEDSAEAAMFMSNLARHLHEAGQLGPARPLLERALALRHTLLGPDDPNTANSASNLALLLLDLDEADRATELARYALGSTEAALGSQHPVVASVCAVYAACLLAQDGPEPALPYALRALSLGKAALARHHPSLQRASRVTADCLDRLGRHAEAEAVRAC